MIQVPMLVAEAEEVLAIAAALVPLLLKLGNIPSMRLI